MLFLSIGPATGTEARSEPPKFASLAVRRSNLTIDAAVAAPYGFSYENGDVFAVGECICRPDDPALRDAVCRVLLDTEGQFMPRSTLLSMVAVNLAQGEVVALCGASSCRPLYYHLDGRRALFSSHVRLLGRAGVPIRLNQAVAGELMVYRFVTPPATVFADILELGGGQRLKLGAATLPRFTSVPWNFAPRGEYEPPSESPVQHCRSVLARSIGDASETFDSPATLFSGGLDSSLIAALTRDKRPGTPLISSSFSFVNPDDPEGEYATSAAKVLGLPLTVLQGSEEGYLRSLVHSIDAAEEPVHHLQSVVLRMLFETPQAQQHDLLLSGEAADGLFGNDAHQRLYKYRAAAQLLSTPAVGGVARSALGLLARLDKRFDYFAAGFDPAQTSRQHLLWSLGRWSSPEIAREHFGFSVDNIANGRQALMAPYAGRGLLDQVSILGLLCEGFKTMTIWSKLAEASGLAIHFPFPDRDLVGYVLSLPWSLKCREPKHVVRQILRDAGIPEPIVARPKKSFGVPPKYWAISGGLLQPVVDMATDYFGADALQRLQYEDTVRSNALWTAVNLYLVKALFIDGVGADALADEVVARHRHKTKINK